MHAIQVVLNEVSQGRRLKTTEAARLYHKAGLMELGLAAKRARVRAVPGASVSYLIDRNINYTNVCNTDCTFCGFYRPTSDHAESYVLSRAEIQHKVEEALELGASRILLQGGHNDDLGYDYYIDLVSWLSSSFDIELNCFSPSEIKQMQIISGKSYLDILSELKQAGMHGLPGGGAEILDDEVRKRVSPKKISSDEWIEVMEVAQSLDLITTATMVIGLGESIENRVNHLQRLRDAQERSRKAGYSGFNAFISWTLQHNENTSMGRSRHSRKYGADSIEYLRMVALSRLFLDNIENHQASWPTLGADTGKMALHFGCNDFGSTMMEENVVSTAGALTTSKWAMSPEELRGHILDAGFSPCERTSSYRIVREFDDEGVERLPLAANA